jgi:hypothetical protein
MKQDTDWTTGVSTSYDPLTLYRLIEKTVLAQTDDQYPPFATVYNQQELLAFYSFRQESLSNPQRYERFNTKVDAGDVIGVTRQHKVLLEYVAQPRNKRVSKKTPKSATFPTLSCARAGRNTATSRWIYRMISPQVTTTTPRTASRHVSDPQGKNARL